MRNKIKRIRKFGSVLLACFVLAAFLCSCEEPVNPTNPSPSGESSIDPTDPTDSTDPTNPTDSSDPTNPTGPTNPTDPTDPYQVPVGDYGEVTLPIPAEFASNTRPSEELLKQYGGFRRKSSVEKTIYLVFTLGSLHSPYTEEILTILREKNIQAIFFIVVSENKSEGELLNRIVADGHIIGNHGYRHIESAELTSDIDLLNNIVEGNNKLNEMIPGYHVEYYMPPSGSITMRDVYLGSALGMKVIGYSWNYYDYDINDQMSKEAALEKMKNGLGPGLLYYLHARPSTTAALGEFIDYALEQGYCFKRLDQ